MNRLRRTIISTIVGLVVALSYILLTGGFSDESKDALFMRICDGFFLSGAILFCVGILALCSNEGTFDLLAFSVKKLGAFLNPFRRKKDTEKQNFIEYKESRMEIKKPFLHLIFSGLILIAIATVFLIIYYQNAA